MATRRDFDWQQDWLDWQLDEDQERRLASRVNWSDVLRRRDDWRQVPSELIRQPVAEGRQRLFVVQTCRWREEWDECACWSPEDGRAVLAFDSLPRAKRFAKQQERALAERFGFVEVETDHLPVGELHLIKGVGWIPWCRREDREGVIVAAFADRYEADQDALDRERSDWRRTCDPAHFFTLEWTSLPPELLGDLFLDLGVSAPPSEAERGYQAVWDWWKQTAPLMDGWQRERLRLAMDRFSPYRVVAVPFVP